MAPQKPQFYQHGAKRTLVIYSQLANRTMKFLMGKSNIRKWAAIVADARIGAE